MKILIIEDDPIWSLKLQMTAEKIGLNNAKIVNNIEAANHFLKRATPDLIITDIMLENETVFNLYKTNKAALHIPTIFITALPNNQNYKCAESVEHFLFLSKSASINTIKSAVNLLLSKTTYLQQDKSEKNSGIRNQLNEVFKLLDETALLQKFNLDEKEIKVITQRLSENKPFTDIGEEIGGSAENARRLFLRGFKKIKVKIKNVSTRYSNFLEFTKNKKNKVAISNSLTKRNLNLEKAHFLEEDYLKQSIDELELLGTKWKNVLHEKNIHKVEDLLTISKRHLLLLPKFGAQTVAIIELELSKRGLKLMT